MKQFTEQDAPPERGGELFPEEASDAETAEPTPPAEPESLAEPAPLTEPVPRAEPEEPIEPEDIEETISAGLADIEEDSDDDEEVEWDGSEAELVADDEAREYEEQQTGIKLSYTLRPEELLQHLLHTRTSKTTGRRGMVEAILLGVLTIVFVWEYFEYGRADLLFFAVVSVLLLLVVLFVPKFGLKRRAAALAADQRQINLEVYPDEIQVGAGEKEWRFPLDGSCGREEIAGLLILYPGKSQAQSLILPLRCVEPAVMAEVQAMIISGTERISEK